VGREERVEIIKTNKVKVSYWREREREREKKKKKREKRGEE